MIFMQGAVLMTVGLIAADAAGNAQAPGATGVGPECAPRLSWGLDFTIGLWSKADGLGLYTRYTRGQDPYNLSFPQMKDNKFQMGHGYKPRVKDLIDGKAAKSKTP